MRGGGEWPGSSFVSDRFSLDDRTGGRIDPIGFVCAGGQVQYKLFDITSRHHLVGALCSTLSMMEIQGVLLTGLTDASQVRSRWNSSRDKALVRAHLEKVE